MDTSIFDLTYVFSFAVPCIAAIVLVPPAACLETSPSPFLFSHSFVLSTTIDPLPIISPYRLLPIAMLLTSCAVGSGLGTGVGAGVGTAIGTLTGTAIGTPVRTGVGTATAHPLALH